MYIEHFRKTEWCLCLYWVFKKLFNRWTGIKCFIAWTSISLSQSISKLLFPEWNTHTRNNFIKFFFYVYLAQDRIKFRFCKETQNKIIVKDNSYSVQTMQYPNPSYYNPKMITSPFCRWRKRSQARLSGLPKAHAKNWGSWGSNSRAPILLSLGALFSLLNECL